MTAAVVVSQDSNDNSSTGGLTNEMAYAIKPLNLQGGQCTWCGKYGHKKIACPYLK
ncbi:hypothetical protein BDF20DRAFT_917875 [Mycotypha africana]|uniref:uncharacterized protein n=1 Tax=Mycotypha africana TaxID=64632 RepID=UPI0023001CAE|nr:uncharacterized protein BDF20DRAFT_917875 [Mycotypha africana]KAI8967071.1 hypothetical protein BDF20DRAFT_917875 [Mycotypha africana]